MLRRIVVGVLMLGLAVVPRAASADHEPEPEPGSVEWQVRDAENMAYAMGRLQDAYTHPEAGRFFWTKTAATYTANVEDQAQHPGRPVLTAAQLIPGGTTADPYRHDWEESGRGVQVAVEYVDRDGVRIRGNVWGPNLPFTDPVTGLETNGPFPGVVITTGSIQGYEELYWWAAQGLAEAGYVVLTYDVQGQGQSETFPHDENGDLICCDGVPFQQAYNFFKGTEDALDFFVSDANPLRGLVDASRIGLAGHSLGASAVTQIGNRETPVPARPDIDVDVVVAWDNANIGDETPRVPTMGQSADYFFNVQPALGRPDDDADTTTFETFEGDGVDAMQVALRGSTHLEWTWVPYILPASREGERVAMHFTLAWFDRYLHPDRATDATARLTAEVFDGSADASAIGFGAWDPETNTNVPHTISGDAVADHLSIYHRSAYAFDGSSCEDMRHEC